MVENRNDLRGMVSGGEHRLVQNVFDVIERGFAARNVEELDEIMRGAFAAYGFDRLSMDQMRDSTGALVGINHFGNPSPEWTAHYLQNQHYLNDGVVRHALTSSSPVRWTEMRAKLGLPRPEAQVFGEASEFGLRDGLVTPVHQVSGNISAVTATSGETLDLSPTDLLSIRLLSLYYCSFGIMLKEREQIRGAPTITLTPRQRECLQWVRAGKTSWEISEIMSISERTVIFHLEAACKRLDVHTRHQAVVEALMLGLIAL